MAINTFGVTPAVVAARVHSLSISTTSGPDTAAIEDVIDEVASWVSDECDAMGIDAESATDSGGTETLYKQLRSAIIYGVADQVLLARSRGSLPADRAYKVQYDETIERIRKRPQSVSSQSGVDVTVDLGAQAYRDATLVPGLPGKILRGGM
jgi:hypothetical protein